MVFLYTFLFRESRFYRIAEHIYIGASAGHVFVMGLTFIFLGLISRISKGDMLYVVPLIAGILMFSTFSKRRYWLSRYAVAVLVGSGTGLALRGTPAAQILAQLDPTVAIIGKDTSTTLNNIVVLIAVVTAITYFIFTREQKGLLRVSSKLGRYFMLVAFGASYGGTVMTRLAVFIPQMQYLLSPEVAVTTAVASIVAVVALSYSSYKKSLGTKRS